MTPPSKRAVLVYLVDDLHRELKKLAAERDTTISDLVERAVRMSYAFEGLVAAEAPVPYGRSLELHKRRTRRRRRRSGEGGE